MEPREPKKRPKGRITQAEIDVFLKALAEGWSTTTAAERSGRSRASFYNMRREDEAFAARWEEAEEIGTDLLEDEFTRRAQGYDETMREYRDGKLFRETITGRHDNQALNTILKARRPEKYRENTQVQITGGDGGPVEIAYTPPTLLDIVRLATQLGVVTRQEVIEGVAEEDEPLGLEAG